MSLYEQITLTINSGLTEDDILIARINDTIFIRHYHQ